MRQKLLIALFIPLVVTAGMAPAREDLVLAIGGEPETGFDPMAGWGSYGNPLFQSTLLKRGPALETLPDLATAWQLSEDRRVWTITLRPDARFSDGSPVRAQDVAFTFRTAREAAGPLDLSGQGEGQGPQPRVRDGADLARQCDLAEGDEAARQRLADQVA